ncbi:MAG: GNAT family N-acetyltransferase [Clostridia bacterium]|nr:GNAT family N-acetyltransferase [Clostridia bacterium]
MIKLIDVRPEHRELLWNVHQKYLYEMTNYYDDEMDAAGNYHYGHFDAYFTEPEREALLIYDGRSLVGFAMVNPYSYIHEKPDHVLAEFTVFPMYRKRHIASVAAGMIFSRYPGRWEIKYNERNAPAKRLWTKVTAEYGPRTVRLNETETVLAFSTECGAHGPG